MLAPSVVVPIDNPSQPISLAGEASNCGIGVNSLRRFPKVVVCTSTKLTTAGRNYIQGDKKAIFAALMAKIFRKFISDRIFTLLTDHETALYIRAEPGTSTYGANDLRREVTILPDATFPSSSAKSDLS